MTKLQTNITIQTMNHWLGCDAMAKTVNATNYVHIAQVRYLFMRLNNMRASERHQVLSWGLYANDNTTIELLAWFKWCIENRIVNHDDSSLDDEDSLMTLLFTPKLVTKTQDVGAAVQQLAGVFHQ